MIKLILSFLFLRRGFRPTDPGVRAQWQRDPLSHPLIERMSQRELGDLPFRR